MGGTEMLGGMLVGLALGLGGWTVLMARRGDGLMAAKRKSKSGCRKGGRKR